MVQRALTIRQQEIYDFVKDKIMNRGYGPTVREIGANFSIRSPNGVMCHLKALERKGLISRESHMSRAIQLTDAPQLKRSSLPLAGTIAAGSPLLAEENYETKDFSGLFNSQEHFCLKVRGDSMIEEHIQEGDFVIIKKAETARDGDIVAALVDGTEATLKYFYKDHDQVRLEPANKNLKPIKSSNVKVLGKLVGVIRQC
jgi:repressor LexA